MVLVPVLSVLYFENHVLIDKSISSIFSVIKKFMSAENLCLIPYVAVLVMYYASNIAVSKITFLSINAKTLARFAASFVCEFGLYLLFIYPENKKDKVINILIVSTVVCSFVVMGNSYDFAWRTCIPLAFYTMLLLAKKISRISVPSTTATVLLVVLLLGAVTPLTEFIRTAQNEILVLQGDLKARSESLATVFTKENNECYANFIGDGDSFFFSNMCR